MILQPLPLVTHHSAATKLEMAKKKKDLKGAKVIETAPEMSPNIWNSGKKILKRPAYGWGLALNGL